MLEISYAYGAQGAPGAPRGPRDPPGWPLRVVKMTPLSQKNNVFFFIQNVKNSNESIWMSAESYGGLMWASKVRLLQGCCKVAARYSQDCCKFREVAELVNNHICHKYYFSYLDSRFWRKEYVCQSNLVRRSSIRRERGKSKKREWRKTKIDRIVR